jgi:hypothetical protein
VSRLFTLGLVSYPLQFFVLLFPEAFVEAVVKWFKITKHDNPAFRNYEALKALLPGDCNRKPIVRERIPFIALVRACCLRLAHADTLEKLLPFFRGCFVGLAPGSPDRNQLQVLSMPKIAQVTGRRDLLPAKRQEYEVCAAFSVAC